MSKCPTQSKVLGYYSLCLITAWLKASESCSGTRGTKELVQSEQMKRISIKDIETHACLLVIHFWPLLESLFQSISFKTTNKWSFPRTWNLHLQSLKWLVSTGVRSQCFVPWLPELQWGDSVTTLLCETILYYVLGFLFHHENVYKYELLSILTRRRMEWPKETIIFGIKQTWIWTPSLLLTSFGSWDKLFNISEI